jgi:hypothetical protein
MRFVAKLILLIFAALLIGYTALIHVGHHFYSVPNSKAVYYLSSRPYEDDVRANFGTPVEEYSAGETIRNTEWHPTPDLPIEHKVLVFILRSTSKVYIYFNDQGQVISFFMAGS